MLKNLIQIPNLNTWQSFNDAGDGGAGGDGGGGNNNSGTGTGEGNATGTPAAGTGTGSAGGAGGEKMISQSELDRILHTRSGEMKQAAETKIAEDLGVSLEEAKVLIADAKKRADDEKSDAQKAREAADAERAAAETEKSSSAAERHAAAVERVVLRNLVITEDMDDDAIDKKVARIARLVEVQQGASKDDIAAAVKSLKDDEPLLFGSEGKSTKKASTAPNGDPKGTAPKGGQAEDGFSKGAERAKALSQASGYPILQDQ